MKSQNICFLCSGQIQVETLSKWWKTDVWETNERAHMVIGRRVEMGTGFTLCLSLVSPSILNVCFYHVQGNFPGQSLLSGHDGSDSHPALFLAPSHAPFKEIARRWAINFWEQTAGSPLGDLALNTPDEQGTLSRDFVLHYSKFWRK